ncbi:hypothetical protein ACHAW5_010850 [Stephanodiscus triporus]|uniref:HMG box domain-containing protein n=1 Tax=Stephanodiscus triporus TaxID=2934178 RepID=A0ABD3NDE3_9STRA
MIRQEATSAGTDVQGVNVNQAGGSMSTAQAPDDSQGKNPSAPADSSSDLAGIMGMNTNMNAMNSLMLNQGLGNNTNMGGTGGADGDNPIGLNSVMNTMLLNNAMQQQQVQGMNMMNPQVLQMMMNQGMIVPQTGQMGMNNYFPQGIMNPSMGMMGGMGNFKAMGGGNMNVPGADNSGATAATAPQTHGNDNDGSSLLSQLMMNPLAAQMMAQGINPMMLLGMGMGGIGHNQLGNANPLAALAMGIPERGVGLPMMANPTTRGGGAGCLTLPMMANTTFGGGTATPAPLFATNNTAIREDGVLKQPVTNLKAGKNWTKKMKVKNKPKRPLSAYNYFFREERARILDSITKPAQTKKDSSNDGDIEVEKKEGEGEDTGKVEVKKEDDEKNLKNTKSVKDGDEENEEETDNVVSEKKGHDDDETERKDYDNVGVDGKKIPHGKIGFENLAKEIGKRWQELGPGEMEKFKKLADEDMTRYKCEMEAFLAKEAQAVGAAGDGNLMAASAFRVFNTKRSHYVDNDVKPKQKRPKQKRSKTIA